MKAGLLEAGAAREIITPSIGTLLFGYRPDVVSTSIHDDLTVTAIAFKNGDLKGMLISVTLCEISNELSDKMRLLVQEASGIPKENIIIAATHTHSGPNTVGIPGWGDIDHSYCDSILLPKTVEAATKAYESKVPAQIGIGSEQCDIAINRRQLNRDGSVSLGQNPWGPYDPTITVISIKGLDYSPIVNLIHYGCHGTAAGCNREISRDWSGPMVDRLEQQSGCLTAFFNGAEGDIGPRLSNGATVGDISHVMELGSKAAVSAVKAYKSIKDYRTDMQLNVAVGEIKLPYRELPSLETVKNAIASYKEPERLINVEYLEYKHWVDILKEYDNNQTKPDGLSFMQTIVAIGPIAFIPFPFEMFVEISLRLSVYSKYQHTLCLSNANGAHSYLPSQDQICRGGYEVREFVAGNTYNLTDDADNRIIDANLKLMEGMTCTE